MNFVPSVSVFFEGRVRIGVGIEEAKGFEDLFGKILWNVVGGTRGCIGRYQTCLCKGVTPEEEVVRHGLVPEHEDENRLRIRILSNRSAGGALLFSES